MTVLQPPAVPVFYPGIPVGTVPAEFNTKIRDPLTFLHNRVAFRATRAAAWNVNSGAANRYVPLDTVTEDPYGGWVSPADVAGGGSTTLNGATAIGASSIVVTSATNFAAFDYLRIDTGNIREYRRILSVAGTTLNLTQPLALAHSSGVAVVEVASDPAVYTVQAPGWYLAEGAISIAASVSTTAAQVLIPGIAVNEVSPIGPGGGSWEGQEVFCAAAAVQHYSSGMWEVYANAGDRIRLNYFLSSETTGNIAVDTTAQCRLTLVWSGV